jgi:hypothetical protein
MKIDLDQRIGSRTSINVKVVLKTSGLGDDDAAQSHISLRFITLCEHQRVCSVAKLISATWKYLVGP